MCGSSQRAKFEHLIESNSKVSKACEVPNTGLYLAVWTSYLFFIPGAPFSRDLCYAKVPNLGLFSLSSPSLLGKVCLYISAL